MKQRYILLVCILVFGGRPLVSSHAESNYLEDEGTESEGGWDYSDVLGTLSNDTVIYEVFPEFLPAEFATKQKHEALAPVSIGLAGAFQAQQNIHQLTPVTADEIAYADLEFDEMFQSIFIICHPNYQIIYLSHASIM